MLAVYLSTPKDNSIYVACHGIELLIPSRLNKQRMLTAMPGGLFDDFFAEEEKNEDSLQAEAESSETVPSDEVESQEVSEVLVEAS